jgi:hypothetical protein
VSFLREKSLSILLLIAGSLLILSACLPPHRLSDLFVGIGGLLLVVSGILGLRSK